jgi:hypothetical protein
MSNVTVVLMPDENHRNRIDLYQSVATDAAGAYRFDRVPPGSYKVFAWEDVEKDAWRNPSFMRLHENRGQSIQVAEGTTATVNAAVVRLR